jgi:hypothetical protein
MHPNSTTPTGKVERHSLNYGGLAGLYNASTELAVARGDHGRNFNAKNAGTEPSAAVDSINGTAPNSSGQYVGNDIIQKNFKIKQPLKVTQFTGAGLNYIDTQGINTTQYAPSGRL